MYRNVVTEMSPDQNRSDRIGQTAKSCSAPFQHDTPDHNISE